ncbi:MAG: GNAT family N-acetyltransferase [Thermodesulfobacteriota bacterium]
MHKKARELGLSQDVYTIQTVEDWLRRLYDKTSIQLPNIEDVFLYTLTPYLNGNFFNSLRDDYPPFDKWFKRKARENNKAWVAWEQPEVIGAICIYVQQDNETITEEGLRLEGPALKLSTFKVGQGVRGRKIGELFLKAAFRYATANRLENIFIHGDEDEQRFLFDMLEDFGFHHVGTHPGSGGRDAVYLKRHPQSPPDLEEDPFRYMRDFFPHYRFDHAIRKFVIPIQPRFHKILFPDYVSPDDPQQRLFPRTSDVGNAIKLAYLCHSQTKLINPGDIVLIYRSADEQCLTSIGIVESYETIEDADIIARRVKRRTVYSMDEIREKAKKPTRVMLFRLVGHLRSPLSRGWLVDHGVLKDRPQSITGITDRAFEMVLENGR